MEVKTACGGRFYEAEQQVWRSRAAIAPKQEVLTPMSLAMQSRFADAPRLVCHLFVKAQDLQYTVFIDLVRPAMMMHVASGILVKKKRLPIESRHILDLYSDTVSLKHKYGCAVPSRYCQSNACIFPAYTLIASHVSIDTAVLFH